MAKTKQPRDPFADRTPRDWFRIDPPKNLTITIDEDDDDDDDELVEVDGSTSADVYIYDVIGGWWGIEASDFVRAIAALEVDQINLYVNSPGGDVFDATAITNALRRHPASVTATVDGIAASAASFLLTAADKVLMGQGTTMMIHDAWSIGIGNAQDMRDLADVLDKLSDNIAGMYAAKAGGTAADWRQVMQDEAWFSAEEAVAVGLADQVVDAPDEGDDAQNAFALTVYAHAGRDAAPQPPIDTIRAAAQAHPRPSKRKSASRVAAATQRAFAIVRERQARPADQKLVSPSGAASKPAEPAHQEKEVAVGDTIEAPTEEQKPAFDVEAFAVAMAAAMKTAVHDELAPFLATAPTAPAPGVHGSIAAPRKNELTYRDAMNLFSARARGTLNKEQREAIEATLTNGAEVFDALTNISLGNATAGGIVNTNPPQWLGELVTKVPYQGLWDYINHEDLTSPTAQAFVLQTEPTGGDKGDGGSAVASTGAKWALQQFQVARWAGADSFDRTAWDFGLEGTALSSYFRVQLRNYYIWRDAKLITGMTTGVTAYPNPAAPANSAITQVTNQILDGVATVLNQAGGLANIATMPIALYKSLLKNSELQAPAFITLDLGALSEGKVEGRIVVRPDLSGTVPAGDVLVANGAGVTGFELPGSPVRAEQVQVSIGNIDVGLFGYALALLDSTNYVALVSQGS